MVHIFAINALWQYVFQYLYGCLYDCLCTSLYLNSQWAITPSYNKNNCHLLSQKSIFGNTLAPPYWSAIIHCIIVIMKELIHTEYINFNYSISIFVKQISVLYKFDPTSVFLFLPFFPLSSTTLLQELTMNNTGVSYKNQKLLILLEHLGVTPFGRVSCCSSL